MNSSGPICGNGGKQLDACLYWYLFNSISDGIFVVEWTPDNLPGQVLEVNDVVCTMLGYTKDEIISRQYTDYCPIKDVCSKPSFLRTLDSGKEIDIELPMKRKNGESFIAEIGINRMYAHGNNSVVAVIRDLTRRKAEEEIRLKHERFMGALATAGAACHELNQPLQAISGYVDMMDRVSNDNKTSAKWVEQIQKQIVRMTDITKKLNSITHLEEQSYVNGRTIMNLERSAS
ncbi:MAG: PAS domain S-box protein [Fibrobacteres bacterium]|nr:PAS domain S-box protein [Fibrobacterota bacterium]